VRGWADHDGTIIIMNVFYYITQERYKISNFIDYDVTYVYFRAFLYMERDEIALLHYLVETIVWWKYSRMEGWV
jgi:hypothetical protein